MLRIAYGVVCLILAGLAGFLYYQQTQETTVLVAARDLPVGTQIADQDLAIRRVAAATAPLGILNGPDQAVGQFIAFPALTGQFLTARHVSRVRAGTALTSGLPVPPGDRVLSLPVGASGAVGGALAPGDLVDVIAVPDTTRTPSGTTLDPAGNTVLGQRVLVLGLRTDQGTALDADPRNAAIGLSKLGSVLIAVPAADEQQYAAAIAVDTFVLTLVTG